MTKELTKTNGTTSIAEMGWNQEQVDLIKRTICKGTTDDEFKVFLYAAKRTGLDPFARQIYAVKRWDSKEKKEVMSIQTGIDGYRLIADRTGLYAGSEEEPPQECDSAECKDCDSIGDHPRSITVTVYKLVGGQKVGFAATARWREYCQRSKEGAVSFMWGKMPYLMLSKCAEALALRKAFPAELSGIYTHEEMGQADVEVREIKQPQPAKKELPAQTAQPVNVKQKINEAQRKRLFALAKDGGCPKEQLRREMKERYGLESTKDITVDIYDALCTFVNPPQPEEPQSDEGEVEQNA